MSRFMRILLFFDLPTKTKLQKKQAAQFRNFLLKDGYYMVQYSVYARICNGPDAVNKHCKRVQEHLPDNGSVKILTITEKQYQNLNIVLGERKKEDEPMGTDLTIL